MRETPRPQETASGSEVEPPQPCLGRASAHNTGAFGSGTPHRSDGRSPQTPRGVRRPGPVGCFGTTPPVPGQPASLRSLFPFSVLRPRTSRPAAARRSSLLPRLLTRLRRPLGPPTVRLLAAALCAVLFSLVTWQVVVGGPLRSLDERIGRGVAGRGPRPLTELFADLGGVTVALPALAAAIAYTLWRDGRAEAGEGSDRRAIRYASVRAVLAMAAVPALVVPLKALVDRPGPLTDATGYYPSGHTATAMVAYCGAAMLLGRRRPGERTGKRSGGRAGRWTTRWAMPAALFLTLATGIGLVFRGYHWPLDVIGSWCLGGTLLLISSIGRRRSSG
ncbi:phosphatase PAP2 family protein [Streptomyces sp. NPDC004838]